jgi:hypothetical protein
MLARRAISGREVALPDKCRSADTAWFTAPGQFPETAFELSRLRGGRYAYARDAAVSATE